MTTIYEGEPTSIPADAAVVAGEGAQLDELATKFPGARHLRITSTGSPGAEVGSLSGTFGPASAAGWAQAEIAAGRRPVLRCDLSDRDALFQALGARALGRHDVDLWLIDLTGEAHLLPDTVATKYAPGRSEAADGWPSPAPLPAQKTSVEPAVTPEVVVAERWREVLVKVLDGAGEALTDGPWSDFTGVAKTKSVSYDAVGYLLIADVSVSEHGDQVLVRVSGAEKVAESGAAPFNGFITVEVQVRG